MNIKEKIMNVFKRRLNVNDFKESDEFKKAVQVAAEKLLDEHLSKLDDTFFEEINKMIQPINVEQHQQPKTQKEKAIIANDILKGENNE